MKKIISFVMCFLLLINSVITVCADDISVSAQACVLYCVNNGKIIFGKNENEKMKMASTTKVMTALLALEQAGSNDKQVEFTQEMIAEGSSMYLQIGDVVTLTDLAGGMLSASGNDAANAAAISIGGSSENFAKLMNERAKQIGMVNTNFVTPSGLDDENHYSTAYDMALLLAYAMENEKFAEITVQKAYKVDFIKPEDKQNTYQNHNRLLSLYQYCIGGKTGYTKSAGRCLVSIAEKDGLRFVAVTLNAPNDWDDHIKLYDYGFSKYKGIKIDDSNINFNSTVVGGIKDNVGLKCKNQSTVVVENGTEGQLETVVCLPNFVYAPVKAGDKIGEIKYMLNGKTVASAQLFANEDIDKIEKKFNLFDFIKGIF